MISDKVKVKLPCWSRLDWAGHCARAIGCKNKICGDVDGILEAEIGDNFDNDNPPLGYYGCGHVWVATTAGYHCNKCGITKPIERTLG